MNTEQTKAKEFLKDWCAWSHESNFEKLTTNSGMVICDHKLHQSWQCCEYHRGVLAKLNALEERAKALYTVPGLGEMTAYWAALVCEHFVISPYGIDWPTIIAEDVIAVWHDRGHR